MEKLIRQLDLPPIGVGTVPLRQWCGRTAVPDNRLLKLLHYGMDLGVMPFHGLRLARTLSYALSIGYRMVDTSRAYGVERWVGMAVKLSGVPREELFLTSRVSNSEQYAGRVEEAVRTSLRLMETDHLDLYMLHWPVPGHFIRSWKVLEKFRRDGVIRHLGVANFHRHHLEQLMAAAEFPPEVNQVEIHPLFTQKPLVEFCHGLNIRVEAYTPLGRFDRRLRENPVLAELAARHGKTIAQIILRWHIQNRVVPLPRSSRREGLKENLAVFDFELTPEEVAAVDALNQDLRLRYNPDTADMTKL